MKKLVKLPNGDEWSGKVKDGRAVGKGTYYHHERGDCYLKEGSVKTGMFDKKQMEYSNYKAGPFNENAPQPFLFRGKGTLVYDSGVYEGDVVGEVRNGKGLYKFNNGAYYEGDFVNDRFDGKGKLVLPDGSRYEGGFMDGRRHGQGDMYFANGDHYSGDYLDGEITGEGIFTAANGEYYAGQFVDGNYEGVGEYSFKNGNFYAGEFKNNFRTGQGTMYYYTGKKYEGGFENNQWKGKGKFTYENGTYLTGVFDGFNSDSVEMHYNKSSVGYGKFINGEYVENVRIDNDDEALDKAINDDLL